jgi:catechol 2,3-dioxygenase-like lactoylglutathione lyase family enzyme
MIAGAHVLIYAEDAEKARAFFRDVLEWEHVEAHPGWLIFQLPPAELGVHPESSNSHELFLMCHDIAQTRVELEAKGAEFTSPVEDEGFGLITRMKIPGAGEISVYQPKHPSPLAEFLE